MDKKIEWYLSLGPIRGRTLPYMDQREWRPYLIYWTNRKYPKFLGGKRYDDEKPLFLSNLTSVIRRFWSITKRMIHEHRHYRILINEPSRRL